MCKGQLCAYEARMSACEQCRPINIEQASRFCRDSSIRVNSIQLNTCDRTCLYQLRQHVDVKVSIARSLLAAVVMATFALSCLCQHERKRVIKKSLKFNSLKRTRLTCFAAYVVVASSDRRDRFDLGVRDSFSK